MKQSEYVQSLQTTTLLKLLSHNMTRVESLQEDISDCQTRIAILTQELIRRGKYPSAAAMDARGERR